ncbi:MAG: response regulator [Myxococcales bacterium]|nr:response regulator [Myxococcales bacterium]MCB9643838.1 response regulator [Myxococcales bacterium]
MSHRQDDVFGKSIPWVALMWLSWFVMWVLYLPLYRYYGTVAGLMGVVPVALTGAVAGRRIGILAALVATGTQSTSMYLAGYPIHVVHPPSLFFAGVGLFAWVGFSLGQMRYLGWRLQDQLHESEMRKEALEEMEARHRALLYALPDCLFHVSEDSRVRDALSWCEVLGDQNPAERPWPSEIDEKMREKIDLVLTSRMAQQLEYQVPTGENVNPAHYEARIVAVHPEEALVILRDITRHKRLEQKLQEAREKALSAAQEQSDFLARMSHEIRTPLHGMMTALELLQSERRQLDDKELLKIVRESGFVLQELVNDILDFSKLEAGRVELEYLRFHFPELIESILAFFWPQAHAKSLRLLGMMDPEIPAYVVGDPLRLRQILMNLIANALKFTPHGEVSLHVERLEDRLRFSIRDTGIGIEEKALASLFQVFQQASNSTTRNFGGTGLGLVIAKQLAELMGGNVEVSSTPGVGSCFAVWLPLTKEKSSAVALSKAKDAPRGLIVVDETPILPVVSIPEVWPSAPRVLWVDRHATRRSWAVRLLSAWGCRCEGVASLDEAEARLLWSEHEPLGVSLCWIEADGMESSAWSWLSAHVESPVASSCAYVVAQQDQETIPRWASVRAGLFVLSRWARQEEMRRVLSLALSWQAEQRMRAIHTRRRSSTEIRLGPFVWGTEQDARDHWSSESIRPVSVEAKPEPSPRQEPKEDRAPQKIVDTFMHRGRARRDSARKREVHWIVREFTPVSDSSPEEDAGVTQVSVSLKGEGLRAASLGQRTLVALEERKPKNVGPSAVLRGQCVEGKVGLSSTQEETHAFVGNERKERRKPKELPQKVSTVEKSHSITKTQRDLHGDKTPEHHPKEEARGRDEALWTVSQKEEMMDKMPHPSPPHWNTTWEGPFSQEERFEEIRDLGVPRILVVEDNLLNQRVMTLTLERLGYSVEIATNGQEALRSLQRHGDLFYAAILMDCQMPELDGYQTTLLIRQRFPRNLPIIGMSASHLDEDRQRALTVGMDDYLAKPVRQESLDRVLSRWCSFHKSVPSSVGGSTRS